MNPPTPLKRKHRNSQMKSVLMFAASVGLICLFKDKIEDFFKIDPEDIKKIFEESQA